MADAVPTGWTAKPTAPGWYWWRKNERDKPSMYHFIDPSWSIGHGQWCGPLSPADAAELVRLWGKVDELESTLEDEEAAHQDTLRLLAALREEAEAADHWLTEAVGDYCAESPLHERLSLRCESAVKKLAAARADLDAARAERDQWKAKAELPCIHELAKQYGESNG